jgi:hypothetical protein
MPRSGTGSYALPAPPSPFQNGQTASATDMMTVLNDVATALTASTAADGQTPITGNWDWNSKNISGVATLTSEALVVTKGGATITGNSTVTGTVSISNGTSGTLAVNYSQFPVTLATTGTMTLPNGYIRKWGTGTYVAGAGSVAFAAAFPTACLGVQVTLRTGGAPHASWPPGADTASISTTGFNVSAGAGQAGTFQWEAWGH